MFGRTLVLCTKQRLINHCQIFQSVFWKVLLITSRKISGLKPWEQLVKINLLQESLLYWITVTSAMGNCAPSVTTLRLLKNINMIREILLDMSSLTWHLQQSWTRRKLEKEYTSPLIRYSSQMTSSPVCLWIFIYFIKPAFSILPLEKLGCCREINLFNT